MNDPRLQLAFAGIHPDRVRDLLQRLGPPGAVRRVAASSRSERARAEVKVDAATRRAELDQAGIGVVFRGQEGYPDGLAALPDAPDVLFVRGAPPQGPSVAVIGTRRCTTYGRRLAASYGSAIARAGWVLVSGLARGIDGAAHRGTVVGHGRGVAVFGSGIDVLYPREHGPLAKELVAGGGAVVSEYPPGTPPEPWRFPLRNRKNTALIAGSRGA